MSTAKKLWASNKRVMKPFSTVQERNLLKNLTKNPAELMVFYGNQRKISVDTFKGCSKEDLK